MAGHSEKLDVEEIRHGLYITVKPGMDSRRIYPKPVTDIGIVPPLSEDEYHSLTDSVGVGSTLSRAIISLHETPDRSRIIIDSTVSEFYVGLAMELAEAVMAVRGLEAAYLTTALRGGTRSMVVIAQQPTL